MKAKQSSQPTQMHLNEQEVNGSIGAIGGRSARAPKEQQGEFGVFLGQPESTQGTGPQGVPGSVSGADSVLPGGRRQRIVDRFRFRMN
jgi:hypothetical protein